jgi:hypothetical protein
LTFGLRDRWTVKRGRRSGARVRLVARTGKEHGSHMWVHLKGESGIYRPKKKRCKLLVVKKVKSG